MNILKKSRKSQLNKFLKKFAEYHEQNKISKKYIYYILFVYTNIISSYFLLFLNCDKIIEKHYSNSIFDLFCTIIDISFIIFINLYWNV